MNVLVFQHLDVEHPGVFREFWEARGYYLHTVELDAGDVIPDVAPFDLLVVMGGPMDVWQEDQHAWLVAEKAAIRHWVKDLGRPYLGICLGHQLLAESLGGVVGMMAEPEVGLIDVEITSEGRQDPLLRGFTPMVRTLQWHGAEVQRMPEDAVVLASNRSCPVQAFRWRRHAYGFQFHMEITASTVADWMHIPEYKESLKRALGQRGAEQLQKDVVKRLHDFRQTARVIEERLSNLL